MLRLAEADATQSTNSLQLHFTIRPLREPALRSVYQSVNRPWHSRILQKLEAELIKPRVRSNRY